MEWASDLAQTQGPKCLDAGSGTVTDLEDAPLHWKATSPLSKISAEEVTTTEDEEEKEVFSPTEVEEDNTIKSRMTNRERKVGVAKRSRRAVSTLSRENGPFMDYVLNLLRSESIPDIYEAHSGRWATPRPFEGIRMFKITEKKGTCGIVVLAMIPKGTDDRAFIVNAFCRNHKSGNNYRTSLADVDSLEKMSEDEYPALAAGCM